MTTNNIETTLTRNVDNSVIEANYTVKTELRSC